MEVLQLFARGPNKHVPHEEGVVGTGADDPHADAVSFIPAGEAIDNVDAIASIQVVDGSFSVDLPDLWSNRTCQHSFITFLRFAAMFARLLCFPDKRCGAKDQFRHCCRYSPVWSRVAKALSRGTDPRHGAEKQRGAVPLREVLLLVSG